MDNLLVTPKVVIMKNPVKSTKLIFEIRADSGKVLGTSQNYSSRKDLDKGVDSIINAWGMSFLEAFEARLGSDAFCKNVLRIRLGQFGIYLERKL